MTIDFAFLIIDFALFIVVAAFVVCIAVALRKPRGNPYAAHDAFVESELAQLRAAGIKPSGDIWKDLI